MMRWEHAKKQIREALTAVESLGLRDRPEARQPWLFVGFLRCPACGDHKSVWSTPKNLDNHAKDLVRWASRHTHKER